MIGKASYDGTIHVKREPLRIKGLGRQVYFDTCGATRFHPAITADESRFLVVNKSVENESKWWARLLTVSPVDGVINKYDHDDGIIKNVEDAALTQHLSDRRSREWRFAESLWAACSSTCIQVSTSRVLWYYIWSSIPERREWWWNLYLGRWIIIFQQMRFASPITQSYTC